MPLLSAMVSSPSPPPWVRGTRYSLPFGSVSETTFIFYTAAFQKQH